MAAVVKCFAVAGASWLACGQYNYFEPSGISD